MAFLRIAARRFGIAGELFSFFWGNKRWWMLPLIGVLFLFAALLILAQSSAIAPFIYTLFQILRFSFFCVLARWWSKVLSC